MHEPEKQENLFKRALRDFWSRQVMSTLARKVFFFSFLAMLFFFILAITTEIDEILTTAIVLAIISLSASLATTAQSYKKFKKQINEQKRDRLKDKGVENVDEMNRRVLGKQNVFHNQEIRWIKRKRREFKLTIFLRLCVILMLVLLIVGVF